MSSLNIETNPWGIIWTVLSRRPLETGQIVDLRHVLERKHYSELVVTYLLEIVGGRVFAGNTWCLHVHS